MDFVSFGLRDYANVDRNDERGTGGPRAGPCPRDRF